jgi:hypothetical protein
VQQELQGAVKPEVGIERKRGQLWMDKQAEDQRKVAEVRKKEGRDSAFDERMRRGDMLEAHREALRRMQAGAKHS